MPQSKAFRLKDWLQNFLGEEISIYNDHSVNECYCVSVKDWALRKILLRFKLYKVLANCDQKVFKSQEDEIENLWHVCLTFLKKEMDNSQKI